ncbi:MAG TPA: YceI family protein [Longimicrobiales bacterium]|nr:YceI family protein [Longimicrobiales bacterium]
MRFHFRTLILPLLLTAIACGGEETEDAAADVTGDIAASTDVAVAGEPAWVLELEEGQASARYRVREQLVNLDLPNDAVGETGAVTGRVVLDAEGNVVPGESRVTVDVSGLRSDRDRRDGYVRRRLLNAEEYPTVELRPTAVRGLPVPLPTSGSHTFEVDGDLTVLDVTRTTTWEVTAQFDGQEVEGTAATRFAFDDFDLDQPQVSVVLSVADTIGLELDFRVRSQAWGASGGGGD